MENSEVKKTRIFNQASSSPPYMRKVLTKVSSRLRESNLKTALFFTLKRCKCFPSTLRYRHSKTQPVTLDHEVVFNENLGKEIA